GVVVQKEIDDSLAAPLDDRHRLRAVRTFAAVGEVEALLAGEQAADLAEDREPTDTRVEEPDGSIVAQAGLAGAGGTSGLLGARDHPVRIGLHGDRLPHYR